MSESKVDDNGILLWLCSLRRSCAFLVCSPPQQLRVFVSHAATTWEQHGEFA